MHVLVTCEYQRYELKTTEKRVENIFPHYKYQIFLDAQ